jgi:hypothetical protein
MAADSQDSGFLSRWSRRKALVRSGEAVVDEPLAAGAPIQPLQPLMPPALPPALPPAVDAPAAEALAPASEQPAPEPTLADVAALTRDSDYSAFVARGVAPDVRNAALKKLFSDPHYNLMDGLDTYIGDYNTPDPLPPGMLRKMVQSQLLGLFDDDEPAATAAPAQPLPPTTPPADENPALQLQPDDEPRRPALEPGAGPDPAVQH